MKPFNHPYFNSEFVVVGTVGSPVMVSEKQVWTCFEAPTAGHSVKPSLFYETLVRCFPGPRLDVFARRIIPGFMGWGNEYPINRRDADV